jgi:predicted AAA+ superfamily ATPase
LGGLLYALHSIPPALASINRRHLAEPLLCKICDAIVYLHMWIKRTVEPHLQHSAKTRPVIVLTGARQTGKTSTFLRLFPKYSFVSLDLPTEAEQAEKDPRSFLQRHPPPVIIDEVQYAPGLFRHLKAEVDAHRTRNGQFLLNR